MRMAISNIAWNVADDEQVALLLNKYGIDAVDVAPGKYFPKPETAGAAAIIHVRDWWASRGIAITGMQALLFGTNGLNMFGSPETQSAMLTHLTAICRIGSALGATRLVFGSPKNRDRAALTDREAQRVAVSFFRRLGDIAGQYGVMFCLEPNPPCYGANFMTNSAETASVVSAVAHSAIKMQLDTGALAINNEDPGHIIREYGALIGHVHASEPNLIALGSGNTDHDRVAAMLETCLPDRVVTIEMLPAKNEPNLAVIERVLGIAIHHYRR